MVASNIDPKPRARSPTARELRIAAGETQPLLGETASDSDEFPPVNREQSWSGLADFEGEPWWRTPSFYWLLAAYPVFTLAFGGIMVPKLNLILSLVCQQYLAGRGDGDLAVHLEPGEDNPLCGELPEIQSKTATFMLAMNLITGSLSVYIAPKLGSLSDRYGRTRFLALSSCGGLAAELVTVIVAKYPETFDYRWLILGSICDGLTGSFTAGSVLAQAYIADCTAPSKRAVALGYIQACLFSGLALGPLLAGYFVEFTGSLLSFFYVALGCHSFFILFIFFATPDSLTPKRRQIAQEKWDDDRRKEAESNAGSKALRIVNPLAPLRMLWPRGPGTSPPLRRNLVALALSDTIIMTSSMGAGPVILLYSRHVFQWNTLMASQFISALSSVRVVALMVLLPAINYLWRVRPAARLRQASGMIPVDKSHGADRLDLWILRAALISDLVGVFGYTFAKDGRIFFLSGMLTAIGGLGSAIIQSVVTKHVPRERTGQILGAIGMMHALARVLGPIAFNGIYAITVKRSYPQAAFVLLGGLFVVALVASAIIKPFVHWEEEPEPEADLVYPAEVILHTGSPPPPLEEDPLIVR